MMRGQDSAGQAQAERKPALAGGGQERMCVVTRAAGSPDTLIRFAASPDGVVTPDIKGKLPGRGVWVTGQRAMLEEAIRRKAFARALKLPVTVPDGLADLVDALLLTDARQSLSLANKAGLVIMGFSKVEAQVASGRAAALVSAADGAADGRRKLRQVTVRVAAGGQPIPMITLFHGSDLDLALGRENAIHAALLAGPAGNAFLARCARLEMFRQSAPGKSGPDAVDDTASTGPFALENADIRTQDDALDDR
jgi:uncharacterized protein